MMSKHAQTGKTKMCAHQGTHASASSSLNHPRDIGKPTRETLFPDNQAMQRFQKLLGGLELCGAFFGQATRCDLWRGGRYLGAAGMTDAEDTVLRKETLTLLTLATVLSVASMLGCGRDALRYRSGAVDDGQGDNARQPCQSDDDCDGGWCVGPGGCDVQWYCVEETPCNARCRQTALYDHRGQPLQRRRPHPGGHHPPRPQPGARLSLRGFDGGTARSVP